MYTTGTLGTATATRSYTYGDSNWKDKLTGWNGQSFTYDAIGNPLSYRDGMSFTWENGRQLAGVTKSGVVISYTYDSSGTRNSKTVGGVTTWYTLAGSQVEKATTGSDCVLYFYDADGAPVSFRTVIGNTTADYYYVKNLQGDIVAICDASGAKRVEYVYDAWGNVVSVSGTLASTIGQSNPYRYRGYWFDAETGLYYLLSRYYDPETGRFINEDKYLSTGKGILSCNAFAYGDNSPINQVDPSGNNPFGVLTLLDYRVIHRMVQNRLSRYYGWIKEVYVKKGTQKGYLDLYDSIKSLFYEVKSYNDSKSSSTNKQINKYTGAVVQDSAGNKRKVKQSIGKTVQKGVKIIESGSFNYGLYIIKYDNSREAPFLITYTHSINWKLVGVCSAAAALVVIVTFPYAAPLLGAIVL